MRRRKENKVGRRGRQGEIIEQMGERFNEESNVGRVNKNAEGSSVPYIESERGRKKHSHHPSSLY